MCLRPGNTFKESAHSGTIVRQKGNLKCLYKLYLSKKVGVESNIALLVEQAMERILGQEQFSVGWKEQCK